MRQISLALACGGLACAFAGEPAKPMNSAPATAKPEGTELATLGGGCFWCMEAVYQQLEGVKSVTSGFAGGLKDNPTYKEVCTGRTGHAEVIQIEYDPKRMTFAQLLDVFWEAHDPTTPNRQGPDAGTQYRSVVFYHDEAQREIAQKSLAEAAKHFHQPVVTQILPFVRFYPAEGYHQNFFRNNPDYPYCQVVISPKLAKLKKVLQKQP